MDETIKGIQKLFKWKNRINDTSIIESERKMFLNDDKTMAIIPNKEYLQKRLETISPELHKIDKPLMINYECNGMINSTFISAKLLIPVLEFIKRAKNENIEIFLKKDTPIQLKMEDLDILIAPRMGNHTTHFEHIELSNALELLSRALKEKGVSIDKIQEIRNIVTSLLV